MVTLDDFCTERDLDEIDFLKVDVEGSDWDVLQGAAGMLSKGAVNVVAIEISEKMNPYFWERSYMIGQPYNPVRSPFECAVLGVCLTECGTLPPPAIPQPSLYSIVAWMDARGYDGFLLGAGARLVPLSGGWWTDDSEVAESARALAATLQIS